MPDFFRFTLDPSPCSKSSKPRVASAHTARPCTTPRPSAVLSSTQQRITGRTKAKGQQLATPRRHRSKSRPMTRVAAGQPGMSPHEGSLQLPTAVMTLSRRGAMAMSIMGRQTAAGMPLPARMKASKSSRTVS